MIEDENLIAKNGISLIWEKIEPLIDADIEEIFQNKDFNEYTKIERRKLIFNYFFGKYKFDKDKLKTNARDKSKDLSDIFKRKTIICNTASYLYKIMLEKVGVYSLATFCKDEEDIHTILIVENGDGTFSFDDVSIPIYHKGKSDADQVRENRFGYDIEKAKEFDQGTNPLDNGKVYNIIPSSMVNFFFGKEDTAYKKIKPQFIEEERSFEINERNIRSAKKDVKNQVKAIA